MEFGRATSTIHRGTTRALPQWLSPQRLWQLLQSQYRSGKEKYKQRVSQLQIEDYRKGYPRFAALIASHGAFHIFRRFSDLRARLLLLTQDKIVHLEEQLKRIDRDEKSPLFLASSRDDRNSERDTVISQLYTYLATYDDMINRSQRIFAYQTPHPKYVSSLQRWLRGNTCIARNEASFLESGEDLLALSSTDDGAVEWLEQTICDKIVGFFKGSSQQRSRDSRVHVFPRSSTIKVARAILSPLITILLLTPVVICNSINSLTAKIFIIIAATGIFICCVSFIMKARTIDLAVAGATYTTVLVVFISGPNLTQA